MLLNWKPQSAIMRRRIVVGLPGIRSDKLLDGTPESISTGLSVGGSDLRPNPSRECLGERDFVYCVHVACVVERDDFYSVVQNSSHYIPIGQQRKLFQFMRRSPALSKYNFIFIISKHPDIDLYQLTTTKSARFVDMKILKVIRQYAKTVELVSCGKSAFTDEKIHM